MINWITLMQRVHANSNVRSDWKPVAAGVPQGTLLGLVRFLMHVNDLQTSSPTTRYVDDCTNWEAIANLMASEWDKKTLTLNYEKTKEVFIWNDRRKCDIPCVAIDGVQIQTVSGFKFFGLDWIGFIFKHHHYCTGKV